MTWVHHMTPQIEQRWKHPTPSTSKIFKVCQSAGNVTEAVFWDARGVTHVKFMPQAQH